MALLQHPELWIALLTLSTLEIVLGVDNLVFISIAVGRLPPASRSAARRIGLGFACITRIALLVVLAELARMDDTHARLFSLFGATISVRDLILIGGGIFLLVKGALEIHDAIYSERLLPPSAKRVAAFAVVIAQIALIDIIPVMIAAIVLAVLVMLFASDPVGNFIDRNPTIRMLALAFILLIGVVLIAEGFDLHIPRAYIYFAMGFSAVVESLNLAAKRQRRRTRRQRESDRAAPLADGEPDGTLRP